MSLPGAPPPVTSPSTAKPAERPPSGDGQVVYKGCHYLGPNAFNAIREHGRAVVNEAWLDEDADYGPLPRSDRPYKKHLADCDSVGSCAAMVLYDASLAIDTAGAADAEQAVASDRWATATADMAGKDAPASDLDTPDRPDSDLVDVIVYFAGLANLLATNEKKNNRSMEDAQLTLSWNHPAEDAFGSLSPAWFGQGYVVGTTTRGAFREAIQGPRPRSDWNDTKPKPLSHAWRKEENAEDGSVRWVHVADHFRLDFHRNPVSANRTSAAAAGLFDHRSDSETGPKYISPVAATLGLTSFSAARIAAITSATPPAGATAPDATCVHCNHPMGMDRSTFPGCQHPCHHACLVDLAGGTAGWLSCPATHCTERRPTDGLAPPPCAPLEAPDATPIQHILLDFQDAVAANTQPACVWDAYLRACHYSGLYHPDSLLRGSLDLAMSWAYRHGETGPALVRFGWACLRDALRARGLATTGSLGTSNGYPRAPMSNRTLTGRQRS